MLAYNKNWPMTNEEMADWNCFAKSGCTSGLPA